MSPENRRENAEAEIRAAGNSLAAAAALSKAELFDDAASRLYYGAFHLVTAALLLRGLDPDSHKAAASLLSQHLVRPGHVPSDAARLFSGLMALRHQADYDRYFELDAAGYADEWVRAQPLLNGLVACIEALGVPAGALLDARRGVTALPRDNGQTE